MRSHFVFWTAVVIPAVAGGAVAAPPELRPAGSLAPAPEAVGANQLRGRFGPEVRIAWDDAWQAPRRVSGLAVPTQGRDAGARVLGFLAATRKDFAAGASAWRVTRVQALPGGGTVVRQSGGADDNPLDEGEPGAAGPEPVEQRGGVGGEREDFNHDSGGERGDVVFVTQQHAQ